MSSSKSPRQPSKKRRIDIPSTSSDPPPEVLPLIYPNLVLKSSKDPNQGLYPRKRSRSEKKKTDTCPTFNKASILIEKNPASRNLALPSKGSDFSITLGSTTSTACPKVFPNQAQKISRSQDLHSRKKDRQSSTSSTFSRASKLIFKIPDNRTQVPFSKSSDLYPRQGSSSDIPTTVDESKKFLESAGLSSVKKGKKSKFPPVSFANKILSYFKPSGEIKSKKKAEVLSSYINTPGTSRQKEPESTLKFGRQALEEVKNEAFFSKFRDCYGLLGDWHEMEEELPNYFDRLPGHVMETILCQIPMLDLLKCRMVCQMWNSVISDDKFMDWKKIYYRLKKGRLEATEYMSNLCQSLKVLSAEDCIGALLKFMAERYSRQPSSDMCTLLEKHNRAQDARLVLAERFPDVLKRESKAWCIFGIGILLCHTVSEILDLYRTVVVVKSECPLVDITNAMYAVAAFFLYYRNAYNINRGLHFRVYSALYSIENKIESSEAGQSLKVLKGLPGQQSIHSYCDKTRSNLSYEQIRILNHCFQPTQVIKIVALAGTGKTTTLIHLSQLYPQVKFLNVMYNKAVCEDAKKRFPPNVTCKTMHSLAFRIHGNQLRHKLAMKIRPHDLVTYLQYRSGSSIQVHSYANLVLLTIESFVASTDEEISLHHVPKMNLVAGSSIKDPDRNKLLKDSLQIWIQMIDKDNKYLRITHDVYLKLYHLSKPKLSEYQCLMVDEAQDCNPAMLDIMTSQNLPLILVGDPNQQIYGFRGAKNALQSVESTHTYHLTKSFRFGPDIAYIATICLDVLKKNNCDVLVGSDKPSFISGIKEGQVAVIARTNSRLFKEAVRLFCPSFLNQPFVEDHKNVHGAFAGGISSYGFDQMIEMYKLSKGPGQQIMDKFISKFNSYKDLSNYAKNVEDSDLLSKLEIVNRYGAEIPDIIKKLKEKCSHSMELANVVLSTAHKSKGLEFDTVFLTDDYPLPNDLDGSEGKICDEESNVLYVALTRAKRCLILSDKLMRVVNHAQEKFEFLVNTKENNGKNLHLSCAHCDERFKPHTVLTTYRYKMLTSARHIISDGYLCMRCRTQPTYRPRLELSPVIMYLDPRPDISHRFMNCLVGPLPDDPPIVHEDHMAINEQDIVYVLNVNM